MPFEAHVVPLESIDGVATQSLEQVRHALRDAPGTVLHLQVADKTGTARTMTLTLRDWV